MFNESPEVKHAYIAYLQERLSAIKLPQQAIKYRKDIQEKARLEILTTTEINTFFSQFKLRVTKGNETGTIPFILDENFMSLPELADDQQRAFAFTRSLATFADTQGTRAIGPLVTYATRDGTASIDARRLEGRLPQLKIKSSELIFLAPYYPSFVASHQKLITLKVNLVVKNADRLFYDDIATKLKSTIKGIVWMESLDPDAIELTVDRVRNDEKIMSERTETVTYSSTDVDFFSAALLMPKNSSYLYDIISGGASLEYGYIVTARRSKTVPVEYVIRGRLDSQYKRCLNASIQNVFGGISRAGFGANENMRIRCAGPSSASIDDLRMQLIDKITRQIQDIPDIKTVHEMN